MRQILTKMGHPQPRTPIQTDNTTAEGVINNKIQAGKEAIELVRQGAVDSFSIGFNIKLSSYNKLNQRIILKDDIEIVTQFPCIPCINTCFSMFWQQC